jgi:predicted protein tyrosine phosphatase
MIEVYSKLWVGDKTDCAAAQVKGFNVLHAAKSCHQRLLDYTKKLDVHDPEYLVASRHKDYLLNLIEAPFEPSVALIEAALGFLSVKHWMKGEPVLIHCDQGENRAPSLALLYLKQRLNQKDVEAFKKKYPKFEPRGGMLLTLKRYGMEVLG